MYRFPFYLQLHHDRILNNSLFFQLAFFRVLSAVLEVMGVSEGHLGRSFVLFTTLNQDKDGLVSQEEFMKAVKNDKSLMDALMVDNNRNKI